MFVNMADQQDAAVVPRILQKGDFVTYSGRTCFIQQITNTIGQNQYQIIDIDSGLITIAARYELTYIPVTLVGKADDIPIPMAMEEKTEETKDKVRFGDVTNEELDKIELDRNSSRTRMQTSWAVGIFKGRSPIHLP